MSFVTFADREAREEGRQEGGIEGLLAGIEVVLQVKFGEGGIGLIPQVRQIDNPERLETFLQTLRTTDNLDAIRAMLPQPITKGDTPAASS